MIVPSPQFLLFALAGALLFNCGRALRWRQLVLLAWNAAFLLSFSHNPLALLPFAGFLAFGYLAMQSVRNGSSQALFAAAAVLTVAALFWLKHYSFIPSALFLPFPYLVVGLSYVFFRVLHLIIDSYQGALEQRVGPLSYLNYTLNFTSLVSGPIQRYEDYRESETHRQPLDLPVAGRALERIVLGYFKVAIVSALLSVWQHQAIAALPEPQGFAGRVWLGMQVVGLYPIYLYFNFSGYVDVVIGVARFFRITLPENFNHPFSAENFINFWSRWHMTLSSWLKTYVYNPLMLASMNHVTAPRLAPFVSAAAFFVTFFLVGLWHGQTSEFLFFGFLQGGGVAANKFYQIVITQRLGRAKYRRLCEGALYTACMRGVTFTWFAFTLLWFWSNWNQIGALVGTLGGAAVTAGLLAMAVAATVILAIMTAARGAMARLTWSVDPGAREAVVNSRYVRMATATAMMMVIVANIAILASPAPEIVYKAF